MLIQIQDISKLPATGWQNILIADSIGMNNTTVSTFDHLVVPRVMVSVLPDELIPGNQASPVISTHHALNDTTQKDELVVNVTIRKSEVNNGEVKFKVPVYAVDNAGKLLTGVDGLLNAKFSSYSPNNEPVVMHDGEGEMPVTLKPYLFDPTAEALDLSNITFFSSNNDCTVGIGAYATAFSASYEGCYNAKATYIFPTSTSLQQKIPQLPEYLRKSHTFFGHVIYGQTAQEFADKIRQIDQDFAHQRLEAVDMLIPILWNEHRKEYMDLLNRGTAEGHFTPIERLQLAAMGIGLVADATPVVHTVYKVGTKAVEAVLKGLNIWQKGINVGSKAVIIASDKALTPAATAGKAPEEAAKNIPPVLGESTYNHLNKCINQYCYQIYDETMDFLKSKGFSYEESNSTINSIGSYWVSGS